ncbi:multinuclear nonheme iron-dependent oxidase [Streptomyces sp. NPDC001732]
MKLGIGIGWRPEIAGAVEALPGIDWVEAVAENICVGHLPDSLARLRERGVAVVPHGVSLGLGGADRPDPGRLADLAARAELLGAPLVTEHIAFVRAGGPRTASAGLEAGHLLPVPRTRDALAVLCENVRIAQDALPVPLALENIAALISWPDEELTEGQFLAELVERTGVRLLIDVANLHTNHVNRGEDPATALDELPVEAIAYVHVAGGIEKDGVWHDTHAHPVTRPVLDVLAELRSRVDPPGVLLERDDDFPPAGELAAELATIRATLDRATPPATATGTAHRPSRAPAVQPVPDASPAPAMQSTPDASPAPDGVRDRLAVAQTALLRALVAGDPAPPGFDPHRLGVQSRALAAKRAGVVARVAPELPEILGAGYRPAFLAYAGSRPMSAGYRRDALDFAESLLIAGRPADDGARRRLTHWWQDRAAARPPRRTTRLIRAARAALAGR